MERLLEDALHVRILLPWIESHEEIINFMRNIPLDKSHLRHQLTLHYFLKRRDLRGNDFDKQIEDDAREIVIVIPDTSYKEIKERLTILGNMPNRKEVVLRQLLHKRCDLERIVKEIEINNTNKRKLDEPVTNMFELGSSNDETNIKIKIRKRDRSLEVVSSIKQEKTDPSKAPTPVDAPSSSTLISSSTSHFESSSPDSTVPSMVGQTHTDNDPCPEFTAILQNVIDSHQPSTSRPVIPLQNNIRSAVPSINNNNLAYTDASNIDKDKQTMETKETPRDKSVITRTSNNSNDSHIIEPDFNLINFLQELTQASENKIDTLCKVLNLDQNKRPNDHMLTYIVNLLFEDVGEVKSEDSSSSSETQEYKLTDDCLENASSKLQCCDDREKSNSIPENSSLNSNTKEFKLKEPILVLNATTTTASNDTCTLPKPISSSSKSKGPILKRPRFTLREETPELREPITIPAMPQTFMERIDRPPRPKGNHFHRAYTSEVPNDPVDLSIPGGSSELINLIDSNLVTSEAGPSDVTKKKAQFVDEKLVLKLLEMFPEACPDYIRDICGGKQWSEFDDILTIILSNEAYPRRPQRAPSPEKDVDPEQQFEILKEFLPDADPTYLRMQCEKYVNNAKGLKKFIDRAVELKNYPTMKEYLRKQQLSVQQKQYTTEFNIEHFIQLFPEPEKTFNDPKRKFDADPYESHYLNLYFRNKYDRISAKTIQQVLAENDNRIMSSNDTFETLMMNKNTMKSRRKPTPLPDNMQNIPLLQELAYLSHKEEISTYLTEKKKKEEMERLDAKKNGLMQTCQCCYDEEVMPKDTFSCPQGCSFCKDCIKKSCEVALGEGKTNFLCLADCPAEFTLQTLQNVLPPKMFSKLAQKKALAEIKAAGIKEVETCPFCDFATIPNEADKIFRCLNPDCMKESCRLCKELNHVPLKCEEVEQDEDVKARTYMEDKMTEALLRKCWKCGTSFFKEEGCNKMTCSCGAQMCYICKQPVKDYSHFNGIGGDKFNLCPLYSDTNTVNQQNVLVAAAAAKAEIDPSKLKVDPSTDVENHYKERAKQLPREPHLALIGNGPPMPLGPPGPHNLVHQHHPHQLRHLVHQHHPHQHLPPQRIIGPQAIAFIRDQGQRIITVRRIHQQQLRERRDNN